MPRTKFWPRGQLVITDTMQSSPSTTIPSHLVMCLWLWNVSSSYRHGSVDTNEWVSDYGELSASVNRRHVGVARWKSKLYSNQGYRTESKLAHHWSISHVISILYTEMCTCIKQETGRKLYSSVFLADRTNGRAINILVQCCVCLSSVCTESIVAKRCVLEQKLLLTAYKKSYMRNRLVPK